jgi:dTMP kinase
MKANPLVVFSGIDGAGKSTQIRMLEQRISVGGRRTLVLWTRIGYTPGMNLARSLARKLLGARIVPPPGNSDARERVFKRRWVRRWWLRLAMLDLIVRWGFWLRLCRWCGYLVICDRYLYDSELDLRLHFPGESASQWWLWRLVVWSCPRPDAAFLLSIPWDEYSQRSIRKREPFPLSSAEFERRLRQYGRMASDEHWMVLDGRRPQAELACMIASRVASSDGALANLSQSMAMPDSQFRSATPKSKIQNRLT